MTHKCGLGLVAEFLRSSAALVDEVGRRTLTTVPILGLHS